MSFAATQIHLEIIIPNEDRERQILYDITHMRNLKYDTEPGSQTKSRLGVPLGVGREGLGVWDQQMQTIVCRVDRQQGPTV